MINLNIIYKSLFKSNGYNYYFNKTYMINNKTHGKLHKDDLNNYKISSKILNWTLVDKHANILIGHFKLIYPTKEFCDFWGKY